METRLLAIHTLDPTVISHNFGFHYRAGHLRPRGVGAWGVTGTSSLKPHPQLKPTLAAVTAILKTHERDLRHVLECSGPACPGVLCADFPPLHLLNQGVAPPNLTLTDHHLSAMGTMSGLQFDEILSVRTVMEMCSSCPLRDPST